MDKWIERIIGNGPLIQLAIDPPIQCFRQLHFVLASAAKSAFLSAHEKFANDFFDGCPAGRHGVFRFGADQGGHRGHEEDLQRLLEDQASHRPRWKTARRNCARKSRTWPTAWKKRKPITRQLLDQSNDQAISADERDKRKQSAAAKAKEINNCQDRPRTIPAPGRSPARRPKPAHERQSRH